MTKLSLSCLTVSLILFCSACQIRLEYESLSDDVDKEAEEEEVEVPNELELSVYLEEPGTLQSKLEGVDVMKVRSLTIEGGINGDDLNLIRNMAGADRYGDDTGGRLRILDLSLSRFRKGGEPYFIYVDKKNDKQTPLSLVDDEVSCYAFGFCQLKEIILPESVTSFASQAFYECDSLLTINMPKYLTEISLSAFYGCDNLCCDIKIPSTVTDIQQYAFYGCKKIPSIKLPPNLESIGKYAFCNCVSIKQIRLPDTITNIPEGLFYGCTSLAEANLSRIVRFGAKCFYRCPLIELDFSPDLQVIEKIAFMGNKCAKDISLPSSLSFIGLSAFEDSSITGLTINSDIRTDVDDSFSLLIHGVFEGCNDLKYIKVSEGCSILGVSFKSCKSLSYVELPESLDSLGVACLSSYDMELEEDDYLVDVGHIFSHCTSLEQIQLPSHLKFIASFSFNGCDKLKSITVPESVSYIGECGFAGCTSLENVTLSSHLSKIAFGCFNGCTSLVKMEIPEGVRKLGGKCFLESAVSNITLPQSLEFISDQAFKDCKGITQISIPSKVKTIPEEAFCGCANLNQVIFPADSKLQSIENVAFYKCTSLNSISLPEGLVSMGDYAFSISGLQTISLPSTIQTIGKYCFANSTRLSHICINALTPPQISEDVFSDVYLKSSALTVPSSAIDFYKSEPVWKDFGNIEPLSN